MKGRHEHRYYTCPVAEERNTIIGDDGLPVICPEKAIRADMIEPFVLDMVDDDAAR